MNVNNFVNFSYLAILNSIMVIIAYGVRDNKAKVNVIPKFYLKLIYITLVITAIEVFITYGKTFISREILLRLLIPKIHSVGCELWLLYLTAYGISVIKDSRNDISRKKDKSLIIANIIFIVSAILTLVLPVEVIYNNSGDWISLSGPSRMMVIINAIINFAFQYIIIIKNKQHKNKLLLPLFVYQGLFIVSEILHAHVPQIAVISFVQSLVVLYIYIYSENPDIKKAEDAEISLEEAERANQEKTDFLTAMSHEIRMPLDTIYGLSEDNLTFSDELPSDVIENCNDIMLASNTLLEIVGNILDVNKIENNKIELVSAPYNFKEEIIKMCKITSTRIGGKDVNFNLSISKNLPTTLYGDCAQVKTVVNNLVTNAIKYTDQGKIDLSIKCKVELEKNLAILTIICEDTGKGISSELLDKLFGKYERLGVEKNTQVEGTGLGLSITKSLVELMGGTITVESEYGHGSKFVVTLPQQLNENSVSGAQIVAMRENKEEKEKEPVINKEEVKEPLVKENKNLNVKKVLIVDDNLSNVKVARRALRGLNVEIDECYDGQECLDKINSGLRYDLILMDIMMPNLSGTKTLEKLKNDPKFDTFVVALTADALSGSREKYLSQGFNEYLAKPVNKQDMKAVFDKLFKE